MNVKNLILAVLAVVAAVAIILFVHGESAPDVTSPLEQLAHNIENLKETYPKLMQANLCTMMQEYTDRVKPAPGKPMVDLGYAWELERRVLEVQCKLEKFFAKTITEIARLEAELRAAHEALQKEVQKR